MDLKPEQKDRLFQLIDSVDCGRYDMAPCEATAIADRWNAAIIRSIRDAFRYGFIKGQRAERAKEKARKPKLLQDMKVRELPTYEFLILNRIHGKERITESVFRYTRGLTSAEIKVKTAAAGQKGE